MKGSDYSEIAADSRKLVISQFFAARWVRAAGVYALARHKKMAGRAAAVRSVPPAERYIIDGGRQRKNVPRRTLHYMYFLRSG